METNNDENYFPSFMSIDMTGISMENVRLDSVRVYIYYTIIVDALWTARDYTNNYVKIEHLSHSISTNPSRAEEKREKTAKRWGV